MAAPSSLTGILSLLPSVSAPSKPTVPTITTPVAPPWRDTTPKTATPSRSSATRERVNPTITVSAAGTRAPLVYGRGQVPAHVATVVVYQNKLYLDIVWALGEINAIESIANPESGLVAGTYDVTHYLGTSSQGVDPWLAAAISGYADTLRGTVQGRAASFAHSVVRVDSLSVDLSKAFLGTLEGRLLYDPRIPGDAYSSNAALVLADALVLGGETVDWAGSEDAFDFCDELVGGAPRWTCNLVIEDPEEVPDLIEELRAYAHCLVVPGPDGVRLIPDAAVASTTAVGVADIQEGSLEIRRRSRRETPTVVRVKYTRTDTTPWSDATAEARLASVDAGTESWRESNISLPGIHTYAEANRTAIERLNAYNLRDLEGQAVLFDSALAHTPGDVLAITHPIGLTGKLMRVLGMDAAEPGRWAATLEEYDPAVYTNSIQSEPTYGDTTLSSPFTVPEITGLAAAEEPYQLENGTFATRFRISWSDADYLYQHKYVVRVTTGGQLVTSGTPAEALWVTGPLQEGNVYKVSVAILAELVGLTGEATEATITAQGKGLIPGNVTGFTGFEVGGEVRLSWNQVIDDVWRYEVRYGTTSTDWDDMNVIDQVDALRLVSKDTPAGTWKFAVKAIDSIGQYSTTEATRTITVTLDTKAFFVGAYELEYVSGDSTKIYEDVWRDGTAKRWTENGGTVNTVFPNVANTYTDPAASYDPAVSEWVSEVKDYGAVYVGNWAVDVSYFSALGTGDSITVYLDLSTSNSPYSWGSYTDPSVKVSARYARIRVVTTATDVLLQDGDPIVRLDVVTREEVGTVTTLTTGPETVSLAQSYEFANWIGLTPSGTDPVRVYYDNVLLDPDNTFEVSAFDDDPDSLTYGDRVAIGVGWRFMGV